MNHDTEGGGNAREVGKYALIGAGLIAGTFLFLEHQTHVLGALPYLLLLACPLMHMFHRHGSHRDHGGDSLKDRRSTAAAGRKSLPGRSSASDD